MGNEGCGHPSVICKKRVTILVEGGEIELFDGEVSAGPSLLPQAPSVLLAGEEQGPSLPLECV